MDDERENDEQLASHVEEETSTEEPRALSEDIRDRDKIWGMDRKKFILTAYIVGLVSLALSILSFGLMGLEHINLGRVYLIFHLIPTFHYDWPWICGIIFAVIFLLDCIIVSRLMHGKRIGSMKRLLHKGFLIPLISSCVVAGVIALVCDLSTISYANAANAYIASDSSETNLLMQPSNILGKAYNQCYPSAMNDSSPLPSYSIDSYQSSISGAASTADTSEIGLIELGCVLSALNLEGVSSGPASLNNLIREANSNTDGALNLNSGPYGIHIGVTYTSQGGSKLLSMLSFLIFNEALNGYRFDATALPSSSSINSSATFLSALNTYGADYDTVGVIVGNSSDIGSNSSQTSSTNGNSSNNLNSSSSNSSSSSSSDTTDAQQDISEAENCSNSNNSLYITPSSSKGGFSVAGTQDWGTFMNCVASSTSMPASIQNSVKSFISKDVTALASNGPMTYSSQTSSWNLPDGSSIFITYAAPLNGTGGWIIDFSNSRSAY